VAASDGRPWVPVLFVSRADGEWLRRRSAAVKLTSTTSHWDAANGTSFATPHVAGAMALLLSIAPHLSGEQLVDLLLGTAVDLGEPGHDALFGAGLLDVDAATRAAAGS
jgi:subtilisin family serine protease